MVSQDLAEFRLAYDGEALIENTMDVRDLAPALIAFGELFTRSNMILNGEKISVSLKVRATQPGSFELVLILAQAYYMTTQFLTSDLVVSASNLVNLVVGVPKVGDSLFRAFKKLKGQKPTAIEQANGVTLKATNIELFVPTEVFRLYQDNEVKRLTQAVIEPLFREGIDKMVVRDNQKELEHFSKEDATTSFTFTDLTNEGVAENIIPKLALRLISPTFDLKQSKWRLDDGSGSKWYGIEDEKFLREVREHKRRFGMGDYLICRVRTVQRVTDTGLEMQRTILIVLGHKVAGEQLSLNNQHENT